MSAFKYNTAIFFVCFITALLYLLLFAYTISPITSYEGCDSCVFKQMGLVLLQGKTPYIGFFDHKGPILYFIQAIGLWLGGRCGIFFLSLMNLTFILYLWYLTARHYSSRAISLLPVLFTLLMYISVTEGGNLTEDWSLLPISYSVYLASKMFAKNECISFIEAISLGISAGLLMFIRANNMALLICAFVFMTYLLFSRKLLKNAVFMYVGAMIGFLLVALFILVFFYLNYGAEGISQMIYCSFTFNITEYSYWPHKSTFEYFFHNIKQYVFSFVVAILITGYSYIKRNNTGIILTVFYIFSFTFCFFTMGRNSYVHYLITVIPLFVMCISSTFRNSVKEYILYIIIVLFVFMRHFLVMLDISSPHRVDAYNTYLNKADSFISSIKKADRESIWNYNTDFTGLEIMQRNGLVPCNRVVLSLQFMSPNLRESEIGKLEAVRPQYILYDPSKDAYNDKTDSVFIHENYTQRDSLSPNIVVYQLRN